ncbi:hypothetical protein TIFTF001_031752 [Ficus carica]|uniref:Uncharacterized protein n=1 Tax=Ficus carica TaxID=3494 RepID=A0AA88J6R4_FICCA|nr:hypothetical protein TIFTF001_031752 [Ficus carica]
MKPSCCWRMPVNSDSRSSRDPKFHSISISCRREAQSSKCQCDLVGITITICEAGCCESRRREPLSEANLRESHSARACCPDDLCVPAAGELFWGLGFDCCFGAFLGIIEVLG